MMNSEVSGNDSKAARPFYFMVSFWGKRYRDFFVDRCLPSLLSPNNFPLLRAEDGHRLLIATTREDWLAIKDLPIMDAARKYVIPILIEIDEAASNETIPGSDAAIYKQDTAQKKLVEAAFAARTYATLLWPDIILADSLVSSLKRWASAGHCLVLFASLRQTEETTLEELSALGYLPKGSHFSQTAQALTLSPRIVADLSVRHLHPEVFVYEANHPHQPPLPAYEFWRISGGRGILLHSFYCVPALMDYGAIKTHDTTCLDEDIFEEIYIRRNFYGRGSTYIVCDSDEFCILSLTPNTVGQFPASSTSPSDLINWWTQLYRIRAAVAFQARLPRNGLKRDMFRAGVRWHGGDFDKEWRRQERWIQALMNCAVGDYFSGADRYGRDFFPGRFSLSPTRLQADWFVLDQTKPPFVRFRTYLAIVTNAISGNSESWGRIGSSVQRRAQKLQAKLMRRLRR